MKLSLSEIICATNAEILKGEISENIYGFSTDTRTVKSGEIYIPLKKEISLIDDLAVPQVNGDTMTVTVYDDPQTRTAV